METYDIHTPIYNNFILDNGIVSHNSGKSVLAAQLCYEFWNNEKRTIIFLSEKKGDPFINALCQFDNREENFIQINKYFNRQERTIPTKLYHPFTFRLDPRTKLPPIKFYTYSIKDLDADSLAIILATEPDNSFVSICEEIKNELTNKEDIWEFIWKVWQSKRKVQTKVSTDFVPLESESKKRPVARINRMFKPFRTDFFIQPENTETNIDYIQILNDEKHWHFFGNEWIEEKKNTYLDLYLRLKGIDQALASGKVKNQVVLVLEEIKFLLPNKEQFVQTIYQKILAQKVVELLQRLRTKCSVIMTMQSIFDTDLRVINTVMSWILFKPPINDIKRLAKDFGFGQDDQNMLYSLKFGGEFTLWAVESKAEGETQKLPDKKFKAFLPPFMVAGQGDSFFKIYEEEHQELMQNNIELYNIMKQRLIEAEEKKTQREREYYQKLEEEEKKKKEKATDSKEVEVLKEKVKEGQKRSKEETMRLCWEIKQANPELSLRKLAEKVNISHTQFDTYVKAYKLKMLEEKDGNN